MREGCCVLENEDGQVWTAGGQVAGAVGKNCELEFSCYDCLQLKFKALFCSDRIELRAIRVNSHKVVMSTRSDGFFLGIW